MKVLIITSLYPPYVMGGAEMVAHSLAEWLAGQGHRVLVLTSAPSPADAGSEICASGVAVERRYFPNLYQIYRASETKVWRKLIWHSRDHFNPASEAIVKEVVERFRPDLVNLHDLQGIGYNLVREVGRQGLPCVQVLHDFGFLCVNMNMFVDGHPCAVHHLSCQASSWLKRLYFGSIKRLSFWSPTQALMERYRPHLPPHLEAFCHPFPLQFAEPSDAPSVPAGGLRLLYVGQVTPPKGVAFLLEVLSELAEAGSFQLTVVGGGESLEPLRRQYEKASWVTFAGRVAPERVADFMAERDLLLVPSLWFENSPLVVRQAVQMALPTLASEMGGLPELVSRGINGILLPAGDASAWRAQIRELLDHPEELARLRAGALQKARSFEPDRLGQEALRLFERTIGEAAATPPTALEYHA